VMRASTSIERILLCLGLLLLSAYGVARISGAMYSRAELQRFSDSRNHSPGHSSAVDGTGAPDFRLWSEQRIAAYKASFEREFPLPVAVLKIPAIHLEVPVLQGTDDLTLNRAVGHIAGTANLGAEGNAGIAGHRDGFFRGLKDVHLGDVVYVSTERAETHYVVDEIVIVPPEDVSVLAPRSKSTLTLVTCYPFYFVGGAPLRYIVHASMADTDNPTKSVEGRSLAQEGEAQEK
jgi:sortase A